MNICLNYWGQPRELKIIKEIYDTQIYDNKYNFYVLFTTYKNEDVKKFVEYFPNSYINQIDDINENDYEEIVKEYTFEHWSNNILHYIRGINLRSKSYETINNYIKEKNIKFDLVLTLRPDSDIYDCKFYNLYDHIFEVLNKNPNILICADKPAFDVHQCGTIPDALFISKMDTIEKILKFPNFKIISVSNNVVHPETASYKHVKSQNIDICYLNFYAFKYERPRYFVK